MTGSTHLRDDVAKARAEDMAWYDNFEALRSGDRRDSVKNSPSHVGGKTSTRVTMNVLKCT